MQREARSSVVEQRGATRKFVVLSRAIKED